MSKIVDGYLDSLSDHVIDEQGRLVLRDDYEAQQECRETLRIQRRQRIGRACLWVALGMLYAVALMLVR